MSDSYRLRYNLQFFGDEKTEEATSKKLSDARSQGQVAKSQELASGIELIAIFLILRMTSGFLGERFISFFRWIYNGVIVDAIKTVRGGPGAYDVGILMKNVIIQMIWILLPYFFVGIVAAALAVGLQFQFKVTLEPLKPNLSKFNPINGLKRIFSFQALFNLGLSLVKIAVIFVIAYNTLVDHLTDLFVLYDLELNRGVALVGDLVLTTGLRISIVYLFVGIIDLIYQKRKFKKDNKMTKQEVKDEYKNSEGDPQIKGKIKQRMREASQRRMMQDVPKADVVITNPTHVAVAIRYDREVDAAPRVIAKGEGYVAIRIKDIAHENQISIVENKPLARTLFSTVDLNQEIPPDLYQAVATILASIYSMKK